MALDPYIDDENDPYVAWARAQSAPPVTPSDADVDPYVVWARGQLPSSPPVPVPSPALATPSEPAREEVPSDALPPRLSPEEESRIEIDSVPQEPATPAPAVGSDASVATTPTPSIRDRANALGVNIGYEVPSPVAAPVEAPDAYLAHMTALANELPLPSMRERAIGEATEEAVSAMTPEQFLKYKTDRESAILLKQAELEHTAAIENERRMRENLEMQRAAYEKADADTRDLVASAAQLARVRVNPNHYEQTRGLAGTVRDVAGVFLMGLGGNVEAGLRVLDQRIQRDIDAQTTDIQNAWQGINARRGAIADELARHGDLYRAQETYRIAAYQAEINDIDTQLQLYDPAGSTAIRGREARDALQAAMQASLLAFNQKQFENSIKLADLRLKQLQIAEKERKLAGGTPAVQYKPEYFEALGLPKPPWPMTEKEHGQWMAKLKTKKDLDKPLSEKSEAQRRKEEAEAVEAEAKAEAAKQGYAIKNPETGEVIKNPDGSPVVEMDATKRNQTSNIIEAAANIRRLADRMAALKKKYGGSINLLGSDEAQEIRQLTSQIDFETFKAFGLGAPSEGDKGLAEGVRGGADPTSFIKDATAGFQAYADAVEKKANTALRNSGYKGPALKFRRASDLPKAKPSYLDDFAATITKSDYAPYDPLRQPLRLPLPWQQDDVKKIDEAFSALAAAAEQPNEQGDQAKKLLQGIASGAVSPAARAKAKSILEQLPGRNPRTDEAR